MKEAPRCRFNTSESEFFNFLLRITFELVFVIIGRINIYRKSFYVKIYVNTKESSYFRNYYNRCGQISFAMFFLSLQSTKIVTNISFLIIPILLYNIFFQIRVSFYSIEPYFQLQILTTRTWHYIRLHTYFKRCSLICTYVKIK